MAIQNIEEISAMNQSIGEAAGQVWRALDREGRLRLSVLQKRIGVPPTLLHLALGWLAREDKVEIAMDGRTYSVQLR